MKYPWTVCTWALMLVWTAVAQSPSQPSASTQASSGPNDGMNSLKVPADTAFFAKLITPMAISQAKDDDTLEAQTTQDIKQGHDVLLKKGATLVGHIHSVQPPTANKPEYDVVIVFDRVKPKNGEEMQFNMVIQALAPESDMDRRSLAEPTGTGIQGATRTAGVTGHSSAMQGNINALTTKSTGVYDVQGLQVGERISEGKHYTVLAATLKDVQLKKGTQLVMKAVGQ
jgi:hypothetical protein